MSELQDLYQEVILDHSKRPRNFREIDNANHHAEGYNPLCGDRFTIYLHVNNGKVEDASFTGAGCAISTASASLMTESLKGKSVEEAEKIFQNFHELVAGNEEQVDDSNILGKLKALSGVRAFPMRVKCATLAWHTMRAAIEGEDESITTE